MPSVRDRSESITPDTMGVCSHSQINLSWKGPYHGILLLNEADLASSLPNIVLTLHAYTVISLKIH